MPRNRVQDRSRARYPRPGSVWQEDGSRRDAAILERNGNLSYVEYEDGSTDWVAPFEL